MAIPTLEQPKQRDPPNAPPASHGTRHKRRILILTAEIGAGHISTAHALKDQLELEDPMADITIDEPIARIPVLSRLPRIYRFVIRYLSPLWALFYYSRRFRSVRSLYGRLMRHRLRPAIGQIPLENYDSVVITYSMYCNCIGMFTEAGLHTTVLVTDMYGGPYEWFIPGAHRYIVPTAQMEQVAKSCRIDQVQILLRRLPTLGTHRPRQRAWSANGRSPLKVLVIGGSEGLGPLKVIADGLLLSKRAVSVTVVCGDNTKLRKRLRGRQLNAKGFVPSVASTYGDYDFVVSKPGSVTLMELLHQNIPFAILPGIPGIEAGNKRTFKRSPLPFIRGRNAARQMANRLVNEDLSLSDNGVAWINKLESIRDALPERSITISELTPTPPTRPTPALVALPA